VPRGEQAKASSTAVHRRLKIAKYVSTLFMGDQQEIVALTIVRISQIKKFLNLKEKYSINSLTPQNVSLFGLQRTRIVVPISFVKTAI